MSLERTLCLMKKCRLEGAIEALDDLWKPLRYDMDGRVAAAQWRVAITPDDVRAMVADLSAKLDALEKEEGR